MATVHPNRTPLAQLTAGELMQPAVITVGRQTPIAEVERVLSDHRISGCPVTDELGHIVGVISIRDLVERYAAGAPRRPDGRFYDAAEWNADEEYGTRAVPDSTEDVAADLMTAEVYAVDRWTTVPEVAHAMLEHGVHRVLVKDRGKFLGLISSTDILRVVASEPAR